MEPLESVDETLSGGRVLSGPEERDSQRIRAPARDVTPGEPRPRNHCADHTETE